MSDHAAEMRRIMGDRAFMEEAIASAAPSETGPQSVVEPANAIDPGFTKNPRTPVCEICGQKLFILDRSLVDDGGNPAAKYCMNCCFIIGEFLDALAALGAPSGKPEHITHTIDVDVPLVIESPDEATMIDDRTISRDPAHPRACNFDNCNIEQNGRGWPGMWEIEGYYYCVCHCDLCARCEKPFVSDRSVCPECVASVAEYQVEEHARHGRRYAADEACDRRKRELYYEGAAAAQEHDQFIEITRLRWDIQQHENAARELRGNLEILVREHNAAYTETIKRVEAAEDAAIGPDAPKLRESVRQDMAELAESEANTARWLDNDGYKWFADLVRDARIRGDLDE